MKQIDILNLALEAAMTHWHSWQKFCEEHPDNDLGLAHEREWDAKVSALFQVIAVEEGRA